MLLQTIFCILTNPTLSIGTNVVVSMDFYCNTHFGIQVIINITKFKKLFSGVDLTTPHSYFTILVEVFTSHILAKNTYFMNHIEWTKHKIMKLQISTKLIGSFIILKIFLSTIHSIIHFFFKQKFLKHNLSMESKIINC